MSIDLNFWKYKKDIYLDHQQVYFQACCEGKAVEGLEELPLAEITQKLKATFFEWTADSPNDYSKEGHGAFQVFTTSQIVRFDCYGMSGDDMNLLIDVMLAFECPLYDPQTATRFDG